MKKIRIGKTKLIKDKNIKQKDYNDIDEFKFDKNTDLIPDKNNFLLCIMLGESKGCYFITRNYSIKQKNDFFRFNNGKYIFDNEAIHITKNGLRISVYMEGISTPLKISNIEKQNITREYIDLFGEKRTCVIQKIKGLKFDAKILDTFTNQELARLFTKKDMDMGFFWLFILSIATIVIGVITWLLIYIFK
jgi:hypothetical protein